MNSKGQVLKHQSNQIKQQQTLSKNLEIYKANRVQNKNYSTESGFKNKQSKLERLDKFAVYKQTPDIII